MLENEKLNNEFFDTNSAAVDSVNDFDDFYDDTEEEPVVNAPQFVSLNNADESDDSEGGNAIPVNNFNFPSTNGKEETKKPEKVEEEKPATKLDFDSVENGTPAETDVDDKKTNFLNPESVFNDIKDEKEETKKEELKEAKKEDKKKEEPALSTLSNEEMEEL